MEVTKSTETSTPVQRSGAAGPRREERREVVAPPVDVFEGPEAILVLLDVPGVTAEGLTVRLDKDELVVSGQRATPALEYRRAFAVPQDVDGEGVTAKLERGVLSLTLPRKASAKPRLIPISSG